MPNIAKNNFGCLDTNLIVHYILNDVPGQREKVASLLTRENSSFVIPDISITESIYILMHIFESREIVSNRLNIFFNHFTNLSYDYELFDEAFDAWVTHPSLSFNDCYLAAYAAKNQIEPVWTFDHKFAVQSPAAKELK